MEKDGIKKAIRRGTDFAEHTGAKPERCRPTYLEKEREDDYGISSFAVSLKSGTEEEG